MKGNWATKSGDAPDSETLNPSKRSSRGAWPPSWALVDTRRIWPEKLLEFTAMPSCLGRYLSLVRFLLLDPSLLHWITCACPHVRTSLTEIDPDLPYRIKIDLELAPYDRWLPKLSQAGNTLTLQDPLLKPPIAKVTPHTRPGRSPPTRSASRNQ